MPRSWAMNSNPFLFLALIAAFVVLVLSFLIQRNEALPFRPSRNLVYPLYASIGILILGIVLALYG